MATRREVMHNLVKEEAKNLKKHATKKELSNLDFNYLGSESAVRCVYGQMVGNCFHPRAIELIQKSCKRVYKADKDDIRDCTINGSPKNKVRNHWNNSYFSPIEVFIDQPINKENGNNEKLIKYLKGETTRLNFK